MAYQSLETRIGRILIENAGLSEKDLEEVLLLQKESKKKIGEILVEKSIIKPEDITKALSKQLGLPYIDDLKPNEIETTCVKGLSIQFCRDNKILPILIKDTFARVAVVDPFDYASIDAMKLFFAREIEVVLTTEVRLLEAINRVFERSESIVKGLEEEADDFNLNINETVDLLEAGDDEAPVIRFVNGLLFRSIKEKTSDIHIEPFERSTTVRFRIDGILYDVYQVPKSLHAAISSRIKVMAELNIAEKRIPQDGRVKVKIAGREIDIRISIVPVNFGERIVMRLLDKSSVVLELPSLGFAESEIKAIDELTNKKYGIFLVTGPTGSGKSTTLSACLKNIATPERNVITVEDPVEYQIQGVGQIAVNPKVGLTFASGLRSILRQDPDVVMVGEIRDKETAEIAINASLTGHLVLSTLHTNDAPGSITRLVDMGIEPFLISSSVVGVLAQRLIRKLCQNCAESFEAKDSDLNIGDINREFLEKRYNKNRFVLKKIKGCGECRYTGYKGRAAIYELMVVSDEIRALINSNEDANNIRKMAVKQGMQSLRDSALNKLVEGLTSIDEVLRLTQTDT